MIQTVFLFILSFVIGVASYIGYTRLTVAPFVKVTSSSPTPTPTLTSTFTYSLEKAPPDTLKARILSREGQALWESRTATIPGVLKEDIEVQQGETVGTAEDASMTLALGDALDIDLQESSLLAFTQTLPQSIVLTQTEGTIEYRLSSRTQPVAVRVRRLLVRLRTGTIQIKTTPDDSVIQVTVGEGSATIAYNDADFTSQRLSLVKGDVFEFDNDTREGSIE
ncbi:hypothetical protein KAZ66_04510 [Candidatus Woesebacteria bacterium]|nr:hypothetical protein [Candidatus Woesebacteria bacterium]